MSLSEKLAPYKKKLLIFGIPIGVLLALCITFGIYSGYYAISGKALPGVKIGSVKVHGKTEAQLIKKLENTEKNIRVSFSNGTKKQYTLTQLGYKLDAKATARKALQYNKSFKNYFRSIFKNYTVVPIYTIDGEALIKASNELSKNYSKAVAAVEPTAAFNKKDGVFKVVSGKDGVGAQSDSIVGAAKKAMFSQTSLNAKATYGPVKPIATNKDAEDLANAANKLMALKLKVDSTGNTENKVFSPDKSTVASWISLPLAASHNKPTFTPDKSKKWLEGIKNNVVVAPIAGSRYVAPSGKLLRTLRHPVNGIKVTNFDSVVKGFTEALKSEKSYTGKLNAVVDPASWKTKTVDPGAEWLPYAAGPGEKWIDINISHHTLTAYQGAKVVKGPFAVFTGARYKGFYTAIGTFKIYSKLRSQTMSGPGYRVPNVPRVMYFYQDYAIHGAPWVNYALERDGKGKDFSHGCVNVPTNNGLHDWLFNWAPSGTVVRTHY